MKKLILLLTIVTLCSCQSSTTLKPSEQYFEVENLAGKIRYSTIEIEGCEYIIFSSQLGGVLGVAQKGKP